MINDDYWSAISLGSTGLLWGCSYCVWPNWWDQSLPGFHHWPPEWYSFVQTWFLLHCSNPCRHLKDVFVCSSRRRLFIWSENHWPAVKHIPPPFSGMRAWRTLQANSRDSEEQKVQLNLSCPLTVSFLLGGNKTPWSNLWHRSLGNKVHDKPVHYMCVCSGCGWSMTILTFTTVLHCRFCLATIILYCYNCYNHIVNHEHIVHTRKA